MAERHHSSGSPSEAPRSAPPKPSAEESGPDSWEDFVEEPDEITVTQQVVASAVTAPSPRRRDRATLTVITGPHTGRVYSLSGSVILGRGMTCDIRLTDPNVSRVHARISVEDEGRCIIEDMNSRNGTFVNGFRQRKCELHSGDRVQLGTSTQFRFAIYDEDEEVLLKKLYESSVRDTLTGVFNRHHFNERLASECSFARRHRTDLALLILDIDHFKHINDTYGHLAGDHVLRSLAGVVSHTLRAEDILCRYGGEEFAVIARSTGPDGAMALAERIRNVVRSASFDYRQVPIKVTVSIGVATFLELEERDRTPSGLIAKADERLYAAKRNGRDRVEGWGSG